MGIKLENKRNESVHFNKERAKKAGKIFIGFIIIFIIIINSIGIKKVNGDSMDPTLGDGSYILFNKLAAYIARPSYGDVVVVQQGKRQKVMRVIGVPGDTVSIQIGKLHINNRKIPEVYVMGVPSDLLPITLEEDQFILMTDNRNPGANLDSIGPISIKNIRGYTVISLFPFSKMTKPVIL